MTQKPVRRGGVTIVALGVTFVIILFAMFFLELHSIWAYQYSIEARAQRAVNAAVEYGMDDRYRSDGYNLMDVEDAASVIYDYLAEDLALSSTSGSGGTCYSASGNPLFSVQYNSISYRDGRGAHCAGIELDMTITMYSKMSLAFTGTPELCSWRSVISSTNFRVDENERAGDYSLLS